VLGEGGLESSEEERGEIPHRRRESEEKVGGDEGGV